MNTFFRYALLAVGFVAMGCAAPTEGDDATNDEPTEEVTSAAKGKLLCLKVTSDKTSQSYNWVTRTIYVKNTCGKTKSITLDLAYAFDPKCQTVNDGHETSFAVSYDVDAPVAVRGPKIC